MSSFKVFNEHGSNRPEDIEWLSTLSDSELDMLFSLKLTVIQRAKVIGCEHLSDKFDLKLLRALGIILLEHLKQGFQNSSTFQNPAEICSILDACKLGASSVSDLPTVDANQPSSELNHNIAGDDIKEMEL